MPDPVPSRSLGGPHLWKDNRKRASGVESSYGRFIETISVWLPQAGSASSTASRTVAEMRRQSGWSAISAEMIAAVPASLRPTCLAVLFIRGGRRCPNQRPLGYPVDRRALGPVFLPSPAPSSSSAPTVTATPRAKPTTECTASGNSRELPSDRLVSRERPDRLMCLAVETTGVSCAVVRPQ